MNLYHLVKLAVSFRGNINLLCFFRITSTGAEILLSDISDMGYSVSNIIDPKH